MDLNIILQFRRTGGSWMCPECDTENADGSTNCSICGHRRTNEDMIIVDVPMESPAEAAAAERKYHSLPSSSGGDFNSPSQPVHGGIRKAASPPAGRFFDSGDLSDAKRLTEHTGSFKRSADSGGKVAGIVIGILVAVIVIVAIAASMP